MSLKHRKLRLFGSLKDKRQLAGRLCRDLLGTLPRANGLWEGMGTGTEEGGWQRKSIKDPLVYQFCYMRSKSVIWTKGLCNHSILP